MRIRQQLAQSLDLLTFWFIFGLLVVVYRKSKSLLIERPEYGMILPQKESFKYDDQFLQYKKMKGIRPHSAAIHLLMLAYLNPIGAGGMVADFLQGNLREYRRSWLLCKRLFELIYVGLAKSESLLEKEARVVQDTLHQLGLTKPPV